jgi:phospholipase/carboxylesterase
MEIRAVPHPQKRLVLIFLHGLTMRPEVLQPMVQALGLGLPVYIPSGPVLQDDGSRSWWAVDPGHRAARLAAGPSDLFDRHPHERPAARAVLAATMAQARREHPGAGLVLVGYSQGGMLLMDHLLTQDERRDDIAGLALLSSTCIALDEWLPHTGRLCGLPALVTHGRGDGDLSFGAGERLRDLLLGAGAEVTWLPFDGGHEMPLVVWRALRRFVARLLAVPSEPMAPPTTMGGGLPGA